MQFVDALRQGRDSLLQKDEFYDGLTQMSPLLIRQAIQEAFDLGLKTELEVSKHITLVYGGVLLENAALIEQHWPILGPQRCSSARGSQEPAAPEYVKQRDSSLPPTLFSKPLSSTMSV